MADEIIRIGFVGAGDNTKLRHIPGFKAIDGVELVSVANRSRASGQRVADEYQIPTVYDSWQELIRADDTDAICVGTWPYMHRTMVLASLDADKHVMTEARMAMNAAEAREMLDASRRKPELVTQIVPAPMTLNVDRTIRDLIADGFLGDVLSVDIVAHQDGFVDRQAPFHWRHDRELSGYNILQLGIWYEAMMRWIGPAASVMAVARVNVPARRDDAGALRWITIPDHVEILCEMASGPVVRMRISAVTGLAPGDGVWFFGTEGTLRLDSGSMTLRGGRRGDDALEEIDIPVEKQGGWRVEEEFVRAVRGLEPITHTGFEDGVKYMEFSEAVTRSAQSGNKIHLPL
ncbi:MAG: Gfo/Idh/MocA family oxidoreductase [Chloroflexi bacterium]|nr:Gfo/Idh/MocA family oxidoreductase [Chloroflexota bacterium]